MIPVYSDKGSLMLSLSKEDLLNPNNDETIKTVIRESVVGANRILLLDNKYTPIE
jgi:hypothetical protein